MSFLFASSHLPEVPVQRPEDDEEDEQMHPPPRAGMVRAFSHLPQVVREEPGNSKRARVLGGRLLRAGSEGLRAVHTDGVAAAKASGVFDAVRQEYNRSDSPHYMDEDGNLHLHEETPRSNSHAPGAVDDAEIPAHHESSAANIHGVGWHEAEDSRPWYLPHLTHEELHLQGHDDDSRVDPGFAKAPPEKWGKPTRDAGFDAIRHEDLGPIHAYDADVRHRTFTGRLSLTEGRQHSVSLEGYKKN